jgi:hypothetical protein
MQQVIKQDKTESTAINHNIKRNPEIQSYTAAIPINRSSSSMSASEEEEQVPAEDNENFEDEDIPEEEEEFEEEQ